MVTGNGLCLYAPNTCTFKSKARVAFVPLPHRLHVMPQGKITILFRKGEWGTAPLHLHVDHAKRHKERE